MSNGSIWSIDKTCQVLTLLVDLGVMAMKGYSAFPKAPALLESQSLVSYAGHSLVESYPSEDMQSVYSTTPADCDTAVRGM